MLKGLLLLLMALALPAYAQPVSQQPHTKVELVAETRTPAPGKPFTVAVVMTPQPGWHTYWKNPGDSGIETRAKWTLPAGATAGDFRYPVPKTYLVSGIMNHVYGTKNALLADITLPAGAPTPFTLAVKLDWLVCDESLCVPESATLSLPLTPGTGAPDPAATATFADARAALPRTLAEPGHFAVANGKLRLAIPFAAPDKVTAAHFFTLGEEVQYAAPQLIGRTNNALIIETAANPSAGAAQAIAGVLRVEQGEEVFGLALTATPGTVPAATPLAPKAADSSGFGLAFALALAGGLLLNVMPCVFPILSLKALSLAKSGASPAAARSEALAYTAGVILICTALGGVAIALAQAGAGAGWAVQLQDPRVILLLMLLTLAIGLNFAGLFEIDLAGKGAGQSLAAKPGAQGAFWTGVLAAFVATPCTGPFMAGALGAALVLPPALGLAVFAGLGLGLALPFLAIGFIPWLRRRLPKPGAWMLTFRRILAIPMLLTALALGWVLGRQAGVDGLALGLLAALLLGLGLWWLGLRQSAFRPGWLPAGLAALAVVAAPVALARIPAPASDNAAEGPGTLKAEAFSAARLAELQAAKTPIFVYFTADWCLTCKVNERGALSRPAVADYFARAGIKVLVGDWTRPDAEIAKFLESRGRAGIPLYLFYRSDGRVEELPQLLTVDHLTGLSA
ncbi:protein-disulfide reductase DsbD family protein [Sandaracinobacteroides saxicola]|uniref:Thioredoxin family protein n=1 Tax=Sandaracinobacteroides saxicola TaxID=2759707 RepID=A0A7G5ILA6_9SPHN|nr:protein-disulfide reductase DsbD domain-containing protein [Sandaracinobacteroides saxicola]QMW24148.1 thioredoxin family protein [Sandaracinobacteroides saxicola]